MWILRLPTASRVSPAPRAPVAEREPTETETLARLYEEQGHFDRAIEIYRRILLTDPTRAGIADKLEAALTRAAAKPSALTTPAVAAAKEKQEERHDEPMGMLDYELAAVCAVGQVPGERSGEGGFTEADYAEPAHRPQAPTRLVPS